MRFRNVIFSVCLIASLANGEDRRIWSNGAYGKVDPREYLPESLYTNCVAWYCMNQNPAQFATWGVPDGSLARNNGAQTNVNSRPTYHAAGHGCLNFDGIDDYYSASPIYANGVSFSFWYNVQRWSYSSAIGNRTPGQFRSWAFYILPDNTKYQFTLNAVADYTVTQTIQTNTWKNIAVVLSGTNLKIYENASLLLDKTMANSIANLSIPFRVGSNANGDTYSGLLDNLMAFNLAITSNDVVFIYKLTKTKYGL